MSSDLVRDGAVLLAAFAVAAATTPIARRVALRFDIVDRPAPNKHHQQARPYLGGVAVAASVLLAAVAALWATPHVRGEVLAIAIGGTAVALVGLVDDMRVLAASPRLAVQAAAAIGLWVAGARVTATGAEAVDLAITVLFVMSVANAVNLLDNMDGLATGTVAVASLYFLGVAAWQGQELVALMAAALAGGSLGFLPYNFPPARIFLGDAGALFLGFLLAALALEVDLKGYGFVTREAVFLLILAVPLFDMALVIVSRWRGGRPVFRGATDHSSHRLMAHLGSSRRVALVTYSVGALSGGVGMSLLVARRDGVSWVAMGATAALALAAIAFLERLGEPKRSEHIPHLRTHAAYTPHLIGRQ